MCSLQILQVAVPVGGCTTAVNEEVGTADEAEMDYYDLQPTPPVLLHFDLMAGEVTSNSIALSNIRQ